jgi:hypothetical protein
MRGLRSTLALVIVLGGLSAYIYFVTWKKPANEGEPKQDKVYASLEADKIEEIHVKSPTGETTVKKSGGSWQIVEPLQAPAEEAKASGVTTSLAALPLTRVVDENPTDLKDYGLAEPRIDVGFKLTGDKDYRHFLIGDKSPTGSDLFAKRSDEKRVVLIASFQETNYSLSTFDLRDKTIIKFDRDKVDGVEVTSGTMMMRLSKEGTDWKIAAPKPLRTDSPSVDGLLNRLQTLQMKTAESENPGAADLKKFGLDKPQVTLNLMAGSTKASLIIGSPTDANNSAVYVRDASKTVVMTMDALLAEDLKKGVDPYRQMNLFDFKPYTLTRLEVARGGQTVVFEKVKGKDDKTPDKWQRVSPSPGEVDKDKMEGLLQKLSNMRAASFVESTAKTGLASPVMTVTAKFDEGKKEERVVFGKVDNDAFASVPPGEPGAAKFDPPPLTEALAALDELSK